MPFVTHKEVPTVQIPDPASLLPGLPSFAGFEVKSRRKRSGPITYLFLGEFRSQVEPSHVFLFGGRFDTDSDYFIPELPESSGHFVVFVAMFKVAGEWAAQRLGQNHSVVYQQESCPSEDPFGPKAIAKNKLATESGPVWVHAEEAQWPTLNREPMVFVGQFRMTDSQPARDWFSWGMEIYVFGLKGEIKIVTQQTDEQSAEDHYSEEDDWL